MNKDLQDKNLIYHCGDGISLLESNEPVRVLSASTSTKEIVLIIINVRLYVFTLYFNRSYTLENLSSLSVAITCTI